METFFVYILQSLKDGSYYVGECDDLDKRMSKHFDGMSKYSASKNGMYSNCKVKIPLISLFTATGANLFSINLMNSSLAVIF